MSAEQVVEVELGVAVGEGSFSSELTFPHEEEWLPLIGSIFQIQEACDSVGLTTTVPFNQRDVGQAARWYIEKHVDNGELLLRMADGRRTQDVFDQFGTLSSQDRQDIEDQVEAVLDVVCDLHDGLPQGFHETILSPLTQHVTDSPKRAEEIRLQEMRDFFADFCRSTSYVTRLIGEAHVDFDRVARELAPCDVDAISAAISMQIACLDRDDTPAVRSELSDFAQMSVCSETQRVVEAYWVHTSNGVISGGPDFVYHDIPIEEIPPILETVACVRTGLGELAEQKSPQLLIRNVLRPVMGAFGQEVRSLRDQASLADEQLVGNLITTMSPQEIFARIGRAFQEEATGDLVDQAEQLEQLYLLYTLLEGFGFSRSSGPSGRELGEMREDPRFHTRPLGDLRTMVPEQVLDQLRLSLGDLAGYEFIKEVVALNDLGVLYGLFRQFPFPRTAEEAAQIQDDSFALRQEATERSVAVALSLQVDQFPQEEIDALLERTLAVEVRSDLLLRADNLAQNRRVFMETEARLREQYRDTILCSFVGEPNRNRQTIFTRADMQLIGQRQRADVLPVGR